MNISTGMGLRAVAKRLAAGLWLVCLLSLGVACSATVYDCGPGKTYTTLGAVPWMNLGPGDVVNIYWRSQPYYEKILLSGRGTPTQPIRIIGIPGPNGQLPVIDGQNATTSPQIKWRYQGTQARGLVTITSNLNQPYGYKPGYIEINGLEMRNACSPNQFKDGTGKVIDYTYNAAGFFVECGEHIVVRGCTIDGNGNGLFVASLASLTDQSKLSKDILVEGCCIYGNSNVGRDREHNVYTEAQGVVFQYNYFGRPRAGAGGNNLKDRSSGTIIRYNWFEGGAHMMDLVEAQEGFPALGLDPDYSETYVYGNVMLNTNGDGAYAVHYGGDQGNPVAYRNGTLYFYNNTVIIRCDQLGTPGARWRSTIFQLTSNLQTLDARNNIIYVDAATAKHKPTDLNLSYGQGILNFGVNWISKGWQVSRPDQPFLGVLNGAKNILNNGANDPGFVNLVPLTGNLFSSDVHLQANSPCVDMGMPLAPTALPLNDVVSQYLAPQAGARRSKVGTAIDLGAYEGTAGGSGPSLPTISLLTLSPATVVGGNSATGTITLSGTAPAGGATVALFSSDTAATVPASITVPAGSSSVAFTVTTSQVSSLTFADITAGYNNSSQTDTLSVQPPAQTNPTVASVTVSPSTVIGGTSATGTVTLSGNAPAGGAVIDLSSDDAAATVPDTVTVPAGQTSVSFTITTSQVSTAVQADITADYNNSSQSDTLSIQPVVQGNPILASVSLSPPVVDGGASATGTVTLTGPAPVGGAVIDLSSSDLAADVPATVTVPAGQTSAAFTVTTLQVDVLTQADITADYNNSSQMDSLFILPQVQGNPTVASVTVSPSTVIGGTSATGTVTLSGNAPAGGAVIDLSSDDAAATVPDTVTVPAGQTSVSFTITTSQVSTAVQADITADYNNSSQVDTLMILPPAQNNVKISSLTMSVGNVFGGDTATGTVTLSSAAPAGGQIVTLSSDNAAVKVPSSVTVLAGQTRASFTASTVPVASQVTATISGKSGGVTKTATLQVRVPYLDTIKLNPTRVRSNKTSTATLTLIAPAGPGGIVVKLSSGNTAVATVPASVKIAAGQTSATVTVTAKKVSSNKTVTITAQANSTRKADLYVSP